MAIAADSRATSMYVSIPRIMPCPLGCVDGWYHLILPSMVVTVSSDYIELIMFEVYSSVLREITSGETRQLPGWISRRMGSSPGFRLLISALTNSVRDYELFRESFVIGDADSERELIRLSGMVRDASERLSIVTDG